MSQPVSVVSIQRGSWIIAALLAVSIASYSGILWDIIDTRKLFPIDLIESLLYAISASIFVIFIYTPSIPPALFLRLGFYILPVVLITLLIASSDLPMRTDQAIALTMPWALVTAFYGRRGGLPKGPFFVVLYVLGAFLAYLITLTAWINEVVWLMPLFPLLLLFWSWYREYLPRIIFEMFLALVLVVFIFVDSTYFPQNDAWFPYRRFVGAAGAASTGYTFFLMGLAYYARFDTAEYRV